MSNGGRTGGRGRYNHQYSGGSNSLGESGRETPLDNAQQQPQSATANVQNELQGNTETPVNADSNLNSNSNNNSGEVSTPSNKDESVANISASTAVDASTIPTVTPSIEDSIEK